MQQARHDQRPPALEFGQVNQSADWLTVPNVPADKLGDSEQNQPLSASLS
jgi:hypothetical protein